MQDLPLLDLHPSRITYASDYFRQMVDTATVLIEAGFLYADDTPTEEVHRVACAARLELCFVHVRAQRMPQQGSIERNSRAADKPSSLVTFTESRKCHPPRRTQCSTPRHHDTHACTHARTHARTHVRARTQPSPSQTPCAQLP
jgi:hypothetical protein